MDKTLLLAWTCELSNARRKEYIKGKILTHFWRFLKRDERTVGENVSSLVVKWLRVYFAATAGGIIICKNVTMTLF